MSQSPNTKHEPSFDDPVDPSQVGDENSSRYQAWLKLNPSGNFEEWQRQEATSNRTGNRGVGTSH